MPETSPRLPFEIDDTIDPTLVTGRAGVPLVIELFRQLGVAAGDRCRRSRSSSASAACRPRSSSRVSSRSGRAAGTAARTSPRSARTRPWPPCSGTRCPRRPPCGTSWRPSTSRTGPLWAAGPQATIPLESAPLAGLGTANRTLVAGLQRGARETTATLDVDATLVESHKDAATVAYDGTRGYQPVVVLWAEQDVIVHDQFRDGHVPAGCGNVRVLRTGRGQPAPRDHADLACAPTAPCTKPRSSAGARSRQIALRHQRRSVGATQGRDPPPPRVGLAGRARGAGRDPRLGRGPVRPGRWGPSEGPALRPPLPRRPRPEAPGESLRRWEQRALLRGGHEPDRGRPRAPPVAPARRRAPWSMRITSSRTSSRPPRSRAGSSGRTPPGSG